MFLFQFCFSGDTQKKNKSWEESNTLSGNTEHLETHVSYRGTETLHRRALRTRSPQQVEPNWIRVATFCLWAKKWRITGGRHLVQIMEKLIIAYGSCQIINAFYIRHPPEFPSVNPFTPPLGSQNKQLMLNRSPQQHTSVFILQRSDGSDFADQFPQSRQPRCGTASVIPWILGWRGVEGERFMEKIAHLFPGCCRAARLHRVPKIIKWRRRLKGRERQRRQRAGKRTRWKAESGAETLALHLPLTSEDQSQEIKTQAPVWDNNRLSLEQSGCFCWAVCSGGLPWGTAAVLPFDLCLHQIWPSNLVNSFLHSPLPLQSPPPTTTPGTRFGMDNISQRGVRVRSAL